MIFILGIIVGLLLSLSVLVVAFIVFSKTKDKIQKKITNIESFITKKEPISIVKRKSEAEEAYAHILNINKDRGGIPDSELK